MRIKTLVINHKHGVRYESALGEELTEEEFAELKGYMSQKMPLSTMNLETEDGSQVFLGPEFMKESVIVFERVQATNRITSR